MCLEFYFTYSNPPKNMTQARDIMDDVLATAMHAMRTVVATSLGSTTGALAFSRDMLPFRLLLIGKPSHTCVNKGLMKTCVVKMKSVDRTTMNT